MALRDVAIAGIYATKQALSLPDRTSIDLCVEAIKGALDDAGLERKDIDGIAVDWPLDTELNETGHWARLFGSTARWTSNTPMDNAGARGVLKTAAAIAAGLCDVAIVGGGRAGPWSDSGDAVGAGGYEFADVWGAYVAPQFALVAQRHMHEFGTTPEQLALVAATIRNNGHTNPEAAMYGRGPYTIEDVLSSRMIATPFHLLDVCIVAEGGAAIVLTSLEHASDLAQPPVVVLGGGMEMAAAPYATPALYRDVGRIGAGAVRRAFAQGGIGPTDIDVFSLYDPNSFEVIRQLEILGLCVEGEGGALVDAGAIALEGKYPTCPDGGTLSYAWNGSQQMTLKVVEAVRQLRGTAVHQIPDAEVAVASNAGAGAQHYEIVVLGKA